MTDHDATPPTSPTPPTTPRATPIACMACGYDLSGTVIGGSCPECGAAVATSLLPTRVRSTNGSAVGALICGILSLLICGLLGPVALIMGILSVREIGRNPTIYTGGSRGMAITGIVLGALTTLLTGGFILFMVLA